MRHGSIFTGIGGFDHGFERAGFESLWQVEQEPFCIAVLRTRFPDAERYYDVLKCGHDRIHKLRPVDVLTAGFPCQDLSVAGKRAGLEGSRSGLFWEVVRILGELRPAWFVLENVPGLFSSCEGRDFAVVLNALDELGYGLAWRVLDSQFFGVAQRRRRVFIVGCFGKPCPEEVLFESESGAGDIAESREAGQDVAYALAARAGGTGDGHGNAWNTTYVGGILGRNTDDRHAGLLDASEGSDDALRASDGHHGFSSPRGDGSDNLVPIAFGANDDGRDIAENICPTVRCGGLGGGGVHTAVAYAAGRRREDDFNLAVASLSGLGEGGPHDNDGQANRIVSAPSYSDRVRDFASLPEGMDSARYRALGNAVTASVAFWIAKRIAEHL